MFPLRFHNENTWLAQLQQHREDRIGFQTFCRAKTTKRQVQRNLLVAYAIMRSYVRRMFEHCLYFNTTALARRVERVWTKAFEPFGLTPPQAFMLRAILDRPGMLQSELATAMKIARPTATRALDGLTRKRLIERRSSERDRRECAIFPTAEGAALKQDLNEASAALTRRHKAQLGNDRFATLVEALKAADTDIE